MAKKDQGEVFAKALGQTIAVTTTVALALGASFPVTLAAAGVGVGLITTVVVADKILTVADKIYKVVKRKE